jgi:predicted DNA-binding protein
MSNENRTFRIGLDLIGRLEEQAQNEGRTMSNLVRAYLNDRVELRDLWPAFDLKTLDQVKAFLALSPDEREKILKKLGRL